MQGLPVLSLPTKFVGYVSINLFNSSKQFIDRMSVQVIPNPTGAKLDLQSIVWNDTCGYCDIESQKFSFQLRFYTKIFTFRAE